MNSFLHGVARAVAEAFVLPGPIVEIGSYQVDGQENVANLRSLFPGQTYQGIDVRQGPGVDLVADVEALPLATASVGTVIAMSTFEHVPHFWKGFEEIRRVLRPDGVVLVACPFYFHIHNYPADYWRFTPQAFEILLHDYGQRILGWHGPAKRPANVWAVGFRENYPAITQGQFEHYQTLLRHYGREPLRPGRVLRYHLARLFCGRGPFAPYLDQECWQTKYHASPLLKAS
jgi:SAM-dependent methyltransferase